MARCRELLTLGLCCFALFGCKTSGDSVSEGGTQVDLLPPDADSYTCNPLSEDGQGDSKLHGIVGSLFYDDSGSQYGHSSEYIEYGRPVDDLILYFNKFFIPTRPFDRGFVTQGGTTIETQNGDTLYEWFGIRFRGRLALDESQLAGEYQVAILSDDGATLKVDYGYGMETLVDNDGVHPTRLGCATEPIYLDRDSRIAFELDYYQGPRYHIALVVLIRPWSDADADDPLCGSQGNSLFFDSTQDPPAPQPAFDALLSREWRVMESSNFYLPKEKDSNPCNEVAPVVSNFSISGVTQNSVTGHWFTDLPATSQLLVTNALTNEVIKSVETTEFVTAHTHSITGLQSNTLYYIKAISESSSGLQGESQEITFRTLR